MNKYYRITMGHKNYSEFWKCWRGNIAQAFDAALDEWCKENISQTKSALPDTVAIQEDDSNFENVMY